MRKLHANKRHATHRLVMVAFCAGLTAMNTNAAPVYSSLPLPVADQQTKVQVSL